MNPVVFAFALIGVVVLGLGLALARNRIVLVWRGAATVAVVERSARGTPWVRFTDAAGRPHVVQMDRSKRYHRYRAGDPYAVRYDTANPEMAFADSWSTLVVLPALTIFAGTLMLLLAAGMHFGAS